MVPKKVHQMMPRASNDALGRIDTRHAIVLDSPARRLLNRHPAASQPPGLEAIFSIISHLIVSRTVVT